MNDIHQFIEVDGPTYLLRALGRLERPPACTFGDSRLSRFGRLGNIRRLFFDYFTDAPPEMKATLPVAAVCHGVDLLPSACRTLCH
jgi:hypothetical protein